MPRRRRGLAAPREARGAATLPLLPAAPREARGAATLPLLPAAPREARGAAIFCKRLPAASLALVAVPAAIAAFAIAVAVTATGGCQSDSSLGGGCQLAQEVMLAGSALTLLPSPRLDRVRQSYVLIGADDANVRWATLDGTSGQLGPEHAAALDTPHAGVWYGVSGGTAPGDSVVMAVGRPAANGTDLDLTVSALPSDGSAGAGAGAVLATLPGAATPGAQPLVAMGSSRQGRAAGLAWANEGTGQLMLAVLGGSGEPVASPSALAQAPLFGCPAFQPGNADLTLTYYKYDGVSPMPTLVITEIGETGGTASTLSLGLTSENPGCPLIAPTDKGYAIAWQDMVGTWLGVYDSGTNRFFIYPAAGAIEFGGADLQPPLAGFGPIGSDYVLVFAKSGSTELWRVDGLGNRRPGVLAFPSLAGDLGNVSSLPASGSLYATYADYTAMDAGVGAAGQRYFVRASCF